MTEPFPRKFSLRTFLICVGGTLLIGFLGGILGGTAGFDTLQKPPLTPPAAVFPVVWTILYLLIGTGAYFSWNSRDIDRITAARLYLIQLTMNALWTVIFFRLELRLFASLWVAAIVVLTALLLLTYRSISKTSFRLTLPYLAWLLFATYLSFAFYFLNR